MQKLGENFGEFTTGLECQAHKCSFWDLEESLIADRVFIDVQTQSDLLREKLLQETVLTLKVKVTGLT
jgi:hypothetical protein